MTEPVAVPAGSSKPARDSDWNLSAEQVLAFDPHWTIFWGDSVVGSQLATWLPYLRRSQYRYLIVSSIDEANMGVRALVEDLPNVIVGMPFEVVREALKQCPTMMGVIYPTTRAPNFGMVTGLSRFSHVWVGHGESEKGVNGPRTASLYDSVFLARYSAINRFPRGIRSWVKSGACAIGAPIVEGTVKAPWVTPRAVRTIMYAPTWEGRRDGADYSSLPEVAPILLELLPGMLERGIKLILRPHPGSGKRVPAYGALVKDLFAAGATKPGSKADDFATADLMISDVSGVTAEFLFTEKPVLLPVTKMLALRNKDAKTLAAEYPWAYPWRVGKDDLTTLLDGLASRDPLRARRASLAAGMFRGHQTIEEATRTFEIALASAQFRKTPVSVRRAFELRMRAPRLFAVLRFIARGPVRLYIRRLRRKAGK